MKLALRFLILLFFFAISGPALSQTHLPRYDTMSYKTNGYYEYLPENYNASGTDTYPLILFMHGISEFGNGSPEQLPYVLRNGITKLIEAGGFPTSFTVKGETQRFIVITPQFKKGSKTSDRPTAIDMDTVLNYIVKHYKVNLNRIYITGLSYGGGLSLAYAGTNNTYAQRIAAIAPMSTPDPLEGNAAIQSRSRVIAANNVPVWAFHNSSDPVEPVATINAYISYINEPPAPTPPAKKTIFTATHHNAWERACNPKYREDGMNLYEWMLQYQRNIVKPNQPPKAIAGADQTITLPANSISLKGEGSDADGSIRTYLWSKVSGPVAGSITSPGAPTTTVTGLVQGSYVFQLTVTDNNGATASDDVSVVVNKAPNVAPQAIAGADQTITLPTNTTTLTGSGKDSDGTPASYAWTKVSGPAGGTLATPATATTAVTALQQGSYVFRLTVTDNDGATGADDITVLVNSAPNQPPKANAGIDQTITLPASNITLQGGATDDGTVSYAWTKLSGPAAGTITSPTTATTTVADLVQGSYVFRLTVTDDKGATATDDVAITVNAAPNQAPQAMAGADQTITLPTNSIALNGSGTDSDGAITVAWTKASGPAAGTITSPTNTATTITGLVPGIYIYRLTVTDDKGAVATDDVTITVNAAPNQAPSAIANADVAITLPVNQVTLSGNGTDNDGTITAYLWTKVSGPAAGSISARDAQTTSVTGLVEGAYIFRLTVTDDDGATGFDELKITVNAAPNQVPVADAGADQSITLPVNSISLTGKGTDGDGTISYAWAKLSGPAAGSITIPNAAATTVTGLAEGTYTFRLTVTDDDGATHFDDIKITVNGAPNQPPTTDAGADQGITLPANTVTLNGTGTDKDGTISSYAWTKVSGPSGTITSPTMAATSVTGLVEGSYVFRLTLTDDDGATATDDVNVVVNAAPNMVPQADAGSDQAITLPVNSLTLNGIGTDGDGTIATYAWTKVSGPKDGTITAPSLAKTTVTGLVRGVYVFRLTVIDNDGAAVTDDVTVTVNEAVNKAPIVNAGADATITLPLNEVTLSGSSTDEDGTIALYLWTKVSGPAEGSISAKDAQTTSVTGLVEGTYLFRLTVTDDDGVTALDEVKVIVAAAPNQAPLIDAGADQSITLPVSRVSLSSTGTDNDGSIVTYSWAKVSGPVAGTITNPDAAATTVTGLTAGTYTFRLTVTDNDGALTTDDVKITVNSAANKAPVARAGTDAAITLPVSQIELQGSGTDEDGTINSYLWTKVSGPAAGNITTKEAAVTTVAGLVQGSYVFRLTIADNDGAIDFDEVQVTVNAAPNQAPVADAGSDITITLPLRTVTLSGKGTDADGTVASYLWTKVSGPDAGTITAINNAQTTLNDLTEGIYTYRLTVTDNNGTATSDDVTITVKAAPVQNKIPIATAGADQSITLPADSLLLSGTGTDSDGSVSVFHWTKVSGPAGANIKTPDAAATSVTALLQGSYVFRLTVTDNDGATASDEVAVTVSAAPVPNKVPVATAGADQSVTMPVDTITLSGAGTDEDGTISSYAWTKVSGPDNSTIVSPAAAATKITGLQKGTYVFRLAVTDDKGATASDELTVTITVVTAVDNDPAAIGFNLTVGPNPTMNQFSLKLTSRLLKPVRLRVTDAIGRIVEERADVQRNTRITIGGNYRPGVYHVEAVQAGRRIVVKLLKL